MTRPKRAAARAQSAALAAREPPLQWLGRRKGKGGRPLLSQAQVDAGRKLAHDYWHAQLQPRITANWSAAAPAQRVRRATPGAGVEMRDAVVAARERVNRALAAVGAELAGVAIDVCCHDMGLETAERARGWPPRSAKVVLDAALSGLARHYGLLPPERPLPQRLRHCGDADYRPTLNEWRC
jgi:hypothetical protein